MTFFNRKIRFKSPPKSDIVIFERIGSRRIKDLILPDLPSYVFDSRLAEIFISAKILFYFLVYLKHIENADSVVLEGGTIQEAGTHKELMENNGLYFNFYAKQGVLSEERI